MIRSEETVIRLCARVRLRHRSKRPQQKLSRKATIVVIDVPGWASIPKLRAQKETLESQRRIL